MLFLYVIFSRKKDVWSKLCHSRAMKNSFYLILFLFPFIVLAEPLKVIGNDDRIQITAKNAQTFHESVGYLTLRIDDTLISCTATVIGKRHAITAAHCLYNERLYRMMDIVSFIPGLKTERRKTQYPYGYFTASKLRVIPDYVSKISSKYDLGLITFSKDLPVKAIPLGTLPKNAPFLIAGYPSDKVDGTLWEASGKRKAYLWGYGPETDEHDVDTMPGQSGAALRYSKDGKDTIVGIHSGGREESNVAYFFTEKSIQLIQTWIKEDTDAAKKN